MARRLALAAALVASLLPVSGAGGAPSQTPKRGGTVVVAYAEHFERACFNPLLDSCSTDLLDLVVAGAYEVGPDATYRPTLANGRIATKEPFTVLYDIRREARWSDGTPVTASDFEFTHQAIRKYGRPDDLHRTHVRSVRVLDAKTVKVVLRAPFVDWRELFAWVLPRHALAGSDLTKVWQGAIDHPRTGAPIGSGPFLVDHVDSTRQLVLRRNPRYWGPHLAYLDRVVLRYVPPGDVTEAMRRGEVDMIDPGPPVLQAATLEVYRQRNPGIRALVVRGNSWEHLEIRIGPGGHPALKRRLVRQALAYGIDRGAIAAVALELAGIRGAEPEPLDSVVFLANSRYYQPNWKGYRYRPAHARRLLERAGCRRGTDGIYVCSGERLSLRFVTSAGGERRKRTLELAQEDLRGVGVDVLLRFVPPSVLGPVIEKGDFDVFQFGFVTGATTAGPYDIFGCQRSDNVSGFCDRLLTRDLEQATLILGDRRRVRLLNRIDARLATAVPALPLFQSTYLLVFDASIRGVVQNGVGSYAWNAEDWWLDR